MTFDCIPTIPTSPRMDPAIVATVHRDDNLAIDEFTSDDEDIAGADAFHAFYAKVDEWVTSGYRVSLSTRSSTR